MDQTGIDLETLKINVAKARHTCAVAKSSLAEAEQILQELLAIYTSHLVYHHGDTATGIGHEH
jgi:hypothetical protein